MDDRQLCEAFGITLEEVEGIVEKVESGDYSDFDFTRTVGAREMPREKMRMISAPVGESRIAAIERVTKARGISRAEFVRRAIDRELLATV